MHLPLEKHSVFIHTCWGVKTCQRRSLKVTGLFFTDQVPAHHEWYFFKPYLAFHDKVTEETFY